MRNIDFKASILASARNLALSERENLNMLVLCKCGFGMFKHADHMIKEDPSLRQEVNNILKEEGLEYRGDSEISHLLSVLYHDVGVDNIKEKITTEKESDIVEDFVDTFDFASLEICFMVIILLLVILITFGLSLRSAVYAKLMAEQNKQQKTIKVARGKNMLWEGSALEDISEDEDLNLIEDSFELD